MLPCQKQSSLCSLFSCSINSLCRLGFFTNLIKLFFFKPVDPIVCPSFTAFNCYLPTEYTTSWGFFKSNVKNKHEEKTCSHHNKYNILKKENKKMQLWVKMEFRMCFCLLFYYCLLVCLFFQCTCTSSMIISFYVHVPPMKQTDLSGRQSRQV